MPRKRPKMSLSQPARPRSGDLEKLFATQKDAEQASGLQLLAIRLDAILPDPLQPRKTFHDERLEELSESIRLDGVIQPIEVSQIGPDQYMIVHGERRWRASQMAGLETIPAIVQRRDYDETDRFVRQLVENIQREDLNDVDRAAALTHLRKLMQAELDAELVQADIAHKPWSKKVSWAKVGERLGYSRQRINQLIKLLELPEEVQEAVRQGTLRERDTRIFQGLNGSQQRTLYKALEAGDISSAEAKKTAKFLKKNPDTTVYQAIRIIRRPPDPPPTFNPPPEEAIITAASTTSPTLVTDVPRVQQSSPQPVASPPPSSHTSSPGQTSRPPTGPSQIDRLGYIRTHLAQIRLQQNYAEVSERDEILRLLYLIQQDVSSLIQTFE